MPTIHIGFPPSIYHQPAAKMKATRTTNYRPRREREKTHLREADGIEVLRRLLTPEVEGHGLRTLSAHHALGEFVQRHHRCFRQGRRRRGGEGRGGTGHGREDGGC